MKKIFAGFFLYLGLTNSTWANDQVSHACAVIDASGNVVNVIQANPNPPDNDASPINGDTLIVIDGQDVSIGCTYSGNNFTCPAKPTTLVIVNGIVVAQ